MPSRLCAWPSARGSAAAVGELARAGGELGRLRRVAAVVGAEAHVGQHARAGGVVARGQCVERRLEVRTRERPLPAAVVEAAEPVLEARQLGRGARRPRPSRSWSARPRSRPPASAGRRSPRAARRGRDGRARARRGSARAPRRWRTAPAPARPPARTRRPRRRRAPRAAGGARPPPSGRGRPEGVGGARMQQAPAREARVLVDQRAQLLVAEVVVRAAFAHQSAPDELLERGDGLLVAASAGGAQRAGVERAAEHGGRRQHLARRLAERVQAGPQQLARPRRQRPALLAPPPRDRAR